MRTIEELQKLIKEQSGIAIDDLPNLFQSLIERHDDDVPHFYFKKRWTVRTEKISLSYQDLKLIFGTYHLRVRSVDDFEIEYIMDLRI